MKNAYWALVLILSLTTNAWTQEDASTPAPAPSPHGRKVKERLENGSSKTIYYQDRKTVKKVVDVFKKNKALGTSRIKLKAKFDKDGNLIRH
ncbi:MAG: hypothetical protein JNL01_01640 [Bdellovibrionales bacterium]|nr:hypothetical protein [Bdellovibrionales bacterium]